MKKATIFSGAFVRNLFKLLQQSAAIFKRIDAFVCRQSVPAIFRSLSSFARHDRTYAGRISFDARSANLQIPVAIERTSQIHSKISRGSFADRKCLSWDEVISSFFIFFRIFKSKVWDYGLGFGHKFGNMI